MLTDKGFDILVCENTPPCHCDVPKAFLPGTSEELTSDAK